MYEGERITVAHADINDACQTVKIMEDDPSVTLQNTDPPVKVKTGDGYGLDIVYYRNRSVGSCNRYCKEKRE